MKIKLKSCPHCGGKAYFNTWGENQEFIEIHCNGLCINNSSMYVDKETAAEAWNRRCSDSHVCEVIE